MKYKKISTIRKFPAIWYQLHAAHKKSGYHITTEIFEGFNFPHQCPNVNIAPSNFYHLEYHIAGNFGGELNLSVLVVWL